MGIIRYTGISGSRSAKKIGDIVNKCESICLVIAPTYEAAKSLTDDISFFVDKEIILIGDEGYQLASYEAESIENRVEREKAIKAIEMDRNVVVVMEVQGAAKKVQPFDKITSQGIKLKIEKKIVYDDLARELFDLGYERSNTVYAIGQYAMRGSIIDIFPIDSEKPVRIELFDDEIERIRYFDIEDQLSKESIDSVEISSAKDKIEVSDIKSKNYVYFWEYFTNNKIFIDDPERCYEKLKLKEEEIKDDFPIYFQRGKVSKEDIFKFTFTDEYTKIYNHNNLFLMSSFSNPLEGAEFYEKIEAIISYEGIAFNGELNSFKREICNYLKEGYEVFLVAESEKRVNSLREYLLDEEIKGNVAVLQGELSGGFVLPHEKKCYITDGDIFGYRKQKRKEKKQHSKNKDVLFEIEKNDYVVHEKYGIGKFLGNNIITVKGEERELLKIKYGGEDILYVPMNQIDLVKKYTGSENPKLTRLGTAEWDNIKKKTKKAIRDMAKELLAMSAKRKAEGGYPFSKDGPWQADFEDKFPFVETEDQLRCVEEIKADMEKSDPMDRLLCGDVGYGKTEVACRAIFKCVAEGKQVALLAPTTILVNQHYIKLIERFEDFPVNIEMLSRFKTNREQKEIIRKLGEGEVDIVVGTHRLLSGDVNFKDIGLLVVDEEQRFGVAAKEKIKALKVGVDMLALSATPIPRTLHMSLIGIKDLSLIEEPPEDRMPIQTYVLEEDDLLIKEAIKRELDRKGQTYVVLNRIDGIQRFANNIRELVPEAKVVVGHGRMPEEELEDIMIKFSQGESDVLVATTIIESGIDIPNVNTLIIIDADKFGLAQLYQIRGRVGRSNRKAFAYLMHKKEKVFTTIASKRLSTIKEFTQFGAGLKIAMKDLEIRGSGNILGGEQHGHMINIGYDLYSKLVEEVIHEIDLESKGSKAISMIGNDTEIDINVNGYIPTNFIENEVQRIEEYQRIAQISSYEEMKNYQQKLKDVFGKLPYEVSNLIKIALIKNMASEIEIKKLEYKNGKFSVIYDDSSKDMNIVAYFEKKDNTGENLLKEIYSLIHILHNKQKDRK